MVSLIQDCGDIIEKTCLFSGVDAKRTFRNERLAELRLGLISEGACKFEQKTALKHSLSYFSGRITHLSLRSRIFGYSNEDAKLAINFLENFCFLKDTVHCYGVSCFLTSDLLIDKTLSVIELCE